jgi:redox-sensitive bicupin YhaK (pirin superfamily)
MVGAWCFLDHLGPTATNGHPMSVGPHPHMGLQTATWLLAGEVRHTDSLGNDVTIVPGQLNLMTAGVGVIHAEQARATPALNHGVQLWIAQPSSTRKAAPDFAHHGDLATWTAGELSATVFVGTFGGVASPAIVATPIVGVELRGTGRAELPLDPAFEYALCLLVGSAWLDGVPIPPGSLADLGAGLTKLDLELGPKASVLLLGGPPFEESILMWWNFVARTRDEIEDAWRDWTDRSDRFGTVESPLPWIDTAAPSWMPIDGVDDGSSRNRA